MTNKNIIFEEKSEIVEQIRFDADQFITVVKAEKSSDGLNLEWLLNIKVQPS